MRRLGSFSYSLGETCSSTSASFCSSSKPPGISHPRVLARRGRRTPTLRLPQQYNTDIMAPASSKALSLLHPSRLLVVRHVNVSLTGHAGHTATHFGSRQLAKVQGLSTRLAPLSWTVHQKKTERSSSTVLQ